MIATRHLHSVSLGMIALGFVLHGNVSAQENPVVPAPLPTATPGGPENAPPAPAASAAPDAKASALPMGLGDAIPQQFREDRYQATFSKNPFLVKTTPVAGPPPVSWAEDWELKGIFDRNGVQTALLSNRKTMEYRRVTPTVDKEGFQLKKAIPDRDRKKSSVEVMKGSETATLSFSDAAAPAGGNGMPGGRPQGVPGAAGGVPVPGARPYPGNTNPMGGAVGQQRPGMPQQQAMGQQPRQMPGAPHIPNANTAISVPGVPPTPTSRRRVLIPTPTPNARQ